MASWLLLITLTALTGFASIAVTIRADLDGRAELGLLASAVFSALIGGPILALGYTELLYPSLVALASLVVSSAAFLASARGRGLVAHARATTIAARALARIPRDAFTLCLDARSVALLGLGGATLAILISAWLTILAPSESWDGFFYHEPIIGFAIQNHGFRVVPLPNKMVVQAINGYPRLCESIALFFVIFTDRTLIEIGNTLAAPGVMLGVYVLARRHGADRAAAIGWSAALLLMPAMLTQLRTSMIDVQVASFLIAAIHFATRPALRRAHALAASLCLALTLCAKSSGLAWVPPLALVTLARLLASHPGDRRRGALVTATIGLALITIPGVVPFARNWIEMRNPLWPIAVDRPRLHLHFPGLASLAAMSPDPPLATLLRTKFGRPIGGVTDLIIRDYGYGVPWIVIPVAAVALGAALITVARARLARSPDRDAEGVLFLALLGAVFVEASPSLNIARYNAHLVALAMVGVAWMMARISASTRLHEGLLAATLALTMIPMTWADWFFGRSVRDLGALAARSASERATMNVEAFAMSAEMACLREQELGPGDRVVFTQELMFPGVLWNRRFSNRVEHVAFRNAATFLAELHRLTPRWVVVGGEGEARAALDAHPGEWEHVGAAVKQDRTVVYRRRVRAASASPAAT